MFLNPAGTLDVLPAGGGGAFTPGVRDVRTFDTQKAADTRRCLVLASRMLRRLPSRGAAEAIEVIAKSLLPSSQYSYSISSGRPQHGIGNCLLLSLSLYTIYIYIDIDIYIYIYVYGHTYIYVHLHAYIYIYIYSNGPLYKCGLSATGDRFFAQRMSLNWSLGRVSSGSRPQP